MYIIDKCKYCGSKNLVKDGFKNTNQRYKCKDCLKHFTNTSFRYKPKEVKALALKLYLNGNSMRSIGKMVGVSIVAILKMEKISYGYGKLMIF